MIRKLLIANRGEIACRVIKTAKQLGIATVAVYSDADEKALHVRSADEAVRLGPAPSKDSYLQIDKIMAFAKQLNVDAIHPGYGFLSENAKFAQACADNDIIFVGPPPSAIEAMGSKSAAKVIMEDAGVPLVPGYHGDDQSFDVLKQAADDMGYPVLLKAAAGGGGKGMRQVWNEAEFSQSLDAAKREAMASFGDDIMLVEKYLTQPRHVEFQVFCDEHGNGVYLFERDCSVQRRHQKVIEEAPAPGMSEALREQMGQAAIKAAQAINYVGAGTVEFLLDLDGSFYFMEMNTRLQVEHPVTEAITGEDLVAWQLSVAAGNTLPKQQSELSINGHSFEARIYAEDPDNEFLPATGTLNLLQPPIESANVRVDTGVVQGDEVSVYYDPMIAKLVVWDTDREKARQRLLVALRDYYIDGVTTNIDFLYNVAASKPFAKEELVTTFIEKHYDILFDKTDINDNASIPLMALAALLCRQSGVVRSSEDAHSPWLISDDWRANETHSSELTLDCSGRQITVMVSAEGTQWHIQWDGGEANVSGVLNGHDIIASVDGHRQQVTLSKQHDQYVVFCADYACKFVVIEPDLGLDDNIDSENSLTAPMNGTVVAHLASVGESVKKGAPLLVMEAMKMEHNITAPSDGKVSEYFYQAGDLVDGGASLLEFTQDDE